MPAEHTLPVTVVFDEYRELKRTLASIRLDRSLQDLMLLARQHRINIAAGSKSPSLQPELRSPYTVMGIPISWPTCLDTRHAVWQLARASLAARCHVYEQTARMNRQITTPRQRQPARGAESPPKNHCCTRHQTPTN